jgi:hypothetical protein
MHSPIVEILINLKSEKFVNLFNIIDKNYCFLSSEINSLLERSLDDRKVSVSDFVSLVGYLAGNTVSRQMIWDFYKDNYDMLSRKLDTTQIGNLLSTFCGYFSDSTKKKEVLVFTNI